MADDDEYKVEPLPVDDPLFSQFAEVFKKFSTTEPQHDEIDDEPNDEKSVVEHKDSKKKNDKDSDKKISNRKIKESTRMTVAELKQKVTRPELVELHDVTAKDPVFLLHLKSVKNSVPIPRHWNLKRKYLQGKRGYEKPPFLLPDFIRQTGIMDMRDSLNESESNKSLKAKTRERVQPKMGKIQMDYQQLHDAFFKWQTKPQMSIHGDLYYEGKEFEKKFKKKPGELSDELRKALGMPTGPNAADFPPPWLAAMKRHGPPPAYPNLHILIDGYKL